MQVNDAGLELIKAFEGFRAEAYRDAVGVWTIGFGHTTAAGPPRVLPGQRISREEAQHILARDVAQFADGVRQCLAVPLTDDQFSALVAFAFNVGLGNFRRSGVLKAVNDKDFEAVPRRLSLWVKAGGRSLPGLVRRRAAEAGLFASGSPSGGHSELNPSAPMPVPDVPHGKPATQSRTLWAAAFAACLGLLQALGSSPAGWVLLVLLLGAMALIMWERVKKMKEEGV